MAYLSGFKLQIDKYVRKGLRIEWFKKLKKEPSRSKESGLTPGDMRSLAACGILRITKTIKCVRLWGPGIYYNDALKHLIRDNDGSDL
jgi:hypothetical protein